MSSSMNNYVVLGLRGAQPFSRAPVYTAAVNNLAATHASAVASRGSGDQPNAIHLAAVRRGAPRGRGAAGMVYELPYHGDLIREYVCDLKRRATSKVVNDGNRMPHGSVCIKLVRLRGDVSVKEFLADNAREAAMHKFLSDKRDEQWKSLALTPRRFIPRFYFAGHVRDKENDADVYVTAMECMAGKPLQSLVKQNIDAATYVTVEKAVATLWMVGVAHSDLHLGNILVTSAGAVFIVDFGNAVKLPLEDKMKVRYKVLSGIQRGCRSLGEVWMSHKHSAIGADLFAYVDRVTWRRQLAFSNPDGKVLMYLYNKVPRAERVHIPLLRARAWGVPAS
jgi:hypothetical protein